MKCENCGNENVQIINVIKGHYSCGKCGRDTERLYELAHDKEIRDNAIEEFAGSLIREKVVDKSVVRRIAEQMKGDRL